MKFKLNKDPKWGYWDITDEQAEKINNGDIDELNSFFLRNYDLISAQAVKELDRLSLGGFYHSSKNKEDVINAFYLDLTYACVSFQSAAGLYVILRRSALAVDRSSAQLARHFSQRNLDLSYKTPFKFVPTEVNKTELRIDEDDYHSIIDLYEWSPSPQEEIDFEQSGVNVPKLAIVLEPFVSPKYRKYIEFFLNGVGPTHANQLLNDKCGNSAYKQIKIGLIRNYKDVLRAVSDFGIDVPCYLQNALPYRFEELVLPRLERELKRQTAEAEKERKRQERAERAKTRKERLREYNREYKRRQRERERAASVSSAV